MVKSATWAFAAAGLIAFASPASAATLVSGSMQTGNGNAGEADASWTVTVPDSSETTNATITNPRSGWAQPISGTKWISGVAAGTAPVGVYTFTNIFNLSNVGNVQSLIVSWLADNRIIGIKLNGISIFSQEITNSSGNFGGPIIQNSFDLNGLNSARLLNGENTMEWLLYNRPAGSNNNSGLSARTIAVSVPEPGTWMLMILGLGAVGFSMRRRQTTSTRFQFA